MSLRRVLPAALFLGVLGPVLAVAPPRVKPSASPAVTRPVVEGNTRFALSLYKEIRAQGGNLFFSPYSISTALSLTSAGARGKTLEQMTATLHLPDQKALHPGLAALGGELASRQGKGVELTTDNRVWLQAGHPVTDSFRDALKASGSVVETADFKGTPEIARDWINRRVARSTRKKVTDLLPAGSVTGDTRVVLANAVYFKGDWANKFKKEKTRPGTFTGPAGKVTVPFMVQTAELGKLELESSDVLELPYAGGELSMLIAVPLADKTLANVEQELIGGKLTGLPELPKIKVEVQLPKFKLTSSLQLPSTLRSMGMDEAFGPTADFSGIDGTKDLYLSGVFHKAFVDVNEEGTEAAASTGAVIKARSKPPVFRADQPFVFVIRDRKTGTVLFLGRVMDPSKG